MGKYKIGVFVGSLRKESYNVKAAKELILVGTALLKVAKTAIIKIPSTIIPNEFNYILNPLHEKHKSFKIIDIADFVYDCGLRTPDNLKPLYGRTNEF